MTRIKYTGGKSPREIADEEVKARLSIGQEVKCFIHYREDDSGYGYRVKTKAVVKLESFENNGYVAGFTGEIVSFEDETDCLSEGDNVFISFDEVQQS